MSSKLDEIVYAVHCTDCIVGMGRYDLLTPGFVSTLTGIPVSTLSHDYLDKCTKIIPVNSIYKAISNSRTCRQEYAEALYEWLPEQWPPISPLNISLTSCDITEEDAVFAEQFGRELKQCFLLRLFPAELEFLFGCETDIYVHRPVPTNPRMCCFGYWVWISEIGRRRLCDMDSSAFSRKKKT
jgi:hypothetical protein